jgi:hypothetical protein
VKHLIRHESRVPDISRSVVYCVVYFGAGKEEEEERILGK